MPGAPVYSVVGLGKVGLAMAAAIASRGFDVIGVDVAEEAVEALNGGPVPKVRQATEPMLAQILSEHRDRLRGTLSYEDAMLASDVSFVIVPTPADSRGAFALEQVEKASASLGRALATKRGYHLVVLSSTVLPGSTRGRLLPVLERESAKRCGQDIGLCYSPVFIALGSVLDDFLNPDFVLIGEYDEQSGQRLADHYRSILRADAPVKRMSVENAEIAKLAVNSFLTAKITFANMLADLCEQVPGADVDLVTDAVGTDRRIGREFLTGGLGYGGPCLPQDNNALQFFANSLGVAAPLPQIVDALNRSRTEALLGRLPIEIGDGTKVAVVGLAYKPRTAVLDESPGVQLARESAMRGARVTAYEPLGADLARAELDGLVAVVDTLKECVRDAELVLLTDRDPSSGELITEALSAAASPVVVVDFWRTCGSQLSRLAGVTYVPVGRSISDMPDPRRLDAPWSG